MCPAKKASGASFGSWPTSWKTLFRAAAAESCCRGNKSSSARSASATDGRSNQRAVRRRHQNQCFGACWYWMFINNISQVEGWGGGLFFFNMQNAYFKTLNIAQGDLKEILAPIGDNNVDPLKIYFQAFRGLMVGWAGAHPTMYFAHWRGPKVIWSHWAHKIARLRPLSAATPCTSSADGWWLWSHNKSWGRFKGLWIFFVF